MGLDSMSTSDSCFVQRLGTEEAMRIRQQYRDRGEQYEWFILLFVNFLDTLRFYSSST
jgi:hypothetical protein